MSKLVIKNAKIVNEGKILEGDLLVNGDRFEQIGGIISVKGGNEVNAGGKLLMPGIIDDQVHFREPGLVHKADIHTESKAAVAGGVTSFMEMPNTKPSCLTQELLQDKYDIANKSSFCNYSFFMGASNDNLDEVKKTNRKNVCGVKVFMGSSTGNMLVDDHAVLNNIFSSTDMLIATHCEDEATIRSNTQWYKEQFGYDIEAKDHPYIRSEEGCYISSSLAIDLAKKHNTRLHILHISTAKELDLFRNDIPLRDKRITSEVCVHHLYFDAADYHILGNKLKCNPAIKEKYNKEALFEALLDDRLDIIATDHAPHTKEEKNKHYLEAPSGLPLVQNALDIMMDFYFRDKISLEKMVEKMCHAPATCFNLQERGYIREGYFADFIIVNPDKMWTLREEDVFYKCGWSPLSGKTFNAKVEQTFVNGNLIYDKGVHKSYGKGHRLLFH